MGSASTLGAGRIFGGLPGIRAAGASISSLFPQLTKPLMLNNEATGRSYLRPKESRK